jgi:hypothetical protein
MYKNVFNVQQNNWITIKYLFYLLIKYVPIDIKQTTKNKSFEYLKNIILC